MDTLTHFEVTKRPTTMRSLQVALKVLEYIGQLQPIGVSELARRLDLPKSTVQRSLKSLAEAGWIEVLNSSKSEWSLTLKAGLAVGRADYSVRPLRLAAVPVMEDLRQRTNESVYLAVRLKFKIALVERLDGINPVVHAWSIWQGGPMHPTSLGKAVLANMRDDEIETYLARPLVSVTDHTETDPDKLREELKLTRERGYSTAFRTNWPNENGVGAVIRDRRGEPTASIAISAPAERVSEAKCIELSGHVMDAARRISLGLARS